MRKRKNKIRKFILIFGLLFIATITLVTQYRLKKIEKITSTQTYIRENIKLNISELLNQNIFPTHIEMKVKGEMQRLELEYTIDKDISAFADKLIKSYKPDYAAVVLMNAVTGEILSLNTFTRDEDFKQNLSLLATYPAASIFKIIPASAAIDKYHYDSELKIGFNGSNHTLYRRNVMAETNRWSRFITLEDAFALSVNTVFAKLALNKLEPHDLEEYTRRFLFNQPILTDFPVEVSSAVVPQEKSYLMAEVASGFNRINKLSPVQGALIAASIANEGKIKLPYIVKSLTNENGEQVFRAEPELLSQPLSAEGAEELKKLMEATVTRGTSKKSFRPLLRDKKLLPIEVGGKTGSLTGEFPRGKVDWFVGYAVKDDQALSIAAITVNKEYWTVKSAFLAQEIFRRYFKTRSIEVSEIRKPAQKL